MVPKEKGACQVVVNVRVGRKERGAGRDVVNVTVWCKAKGAGKDLVDVGPVREAQEYVWSMRWREARSRK